MTYKPRAIYFLGVFLLLLILLVLQKHLGDSGKCTDVKADMSLSELMGKPIMNGSPTVSKTTPHHTHPAHPLTHTTDPTKNSGSSEGNQSKPFDPSLILQTQKIFREYFDGHPLPEGLRLLKPQKLGSNYHIDATLPDKPAENIFIEFVRNDHVECVNRRRHGSHKDGGWDMCISGPFLPRPGQPCLVYSFGINFDWTFDDSVSTEYGCKVRSFDPSMHKEEHQHSDRVHFYPWGLGQFNQVTRWTLNSLGTILTELGDNNTVIDYLKIDIEGAEWDCFETMFTENVLQRVKQIGFEIHTRELQLSTTSAVFKPELSMKDKSRTMDYRRYIRILSTLESLGFRKWYTHLNEWGLFRSQRTNRYISCCYEMVYINLNFIKPDHLAGGLPTLDLTVANSQGKNMSKQQLIPGNLFPEFTTLETKPPVLPSSPWQMNETEQYFYDSLDQKSIVCPNSLLIGTEANTSWNICHRKPYALREPCVIMSFGYVNDTSFAPMIANQTKCQVHSFHPRLQGKLGDHLMHHKLGLGSRKTTLESDHKTDTFVNLVRDTGNSDSTINIVKIELVTKDQWTSLDMMVQTGAILRIQQLLILVCIEEQQLNTDEFKASQFISYTNTLNSLKTKGFRLWSTGPADGDRFNSKWTGQKRSACTKLSYINANCLT